MSILVGRKAPDFIMPAVLGSGEMSMDEFRFLDAKGDRYAVLCFYPLDFTFVCPTDLIALESRFAAYLTEHAAL
jgi:peroxiredoxin (alkyl hydroperoxide reductase subunit C)